MGLFTTHTETPNVTSGVDEHVRENYTYIGVMAYSPDLVLSVRHTKSKKLMALKIVNYRTGDVRSIEREAKTLKAISKTKSRDRRAKHLSKLFEFFTVRALAIVERQRLTSTLTN